jgi:hypothetical protein
MHTNSWFFGMLSIWMCPWLALEWFLGFYSYLVFRSSSIIGQCPANMVILPPKIGDILMCPKITWSFCQSGLYYFD